MKQLRGKLRAYYFTAVLSLVFAVVGFSYNAWRLEVSEDNYNIRTASFEMLITLAELQQLIFAAHYDNDSVQGNPRTGWVKVGLIQDLSALVGPAVQEKSQQLKTTWTNSWEAMSTDRGAVDKSVNAIDAVRDEIKATLSRLD